MPYSAPKRACVNCEFASDDFDTVVGTAVEVAMVDRNQPE